MTSLEIWKTQVNDKKLKISSFNILNEIAKGRDKSRAAQVDKQAIKVAIDQFIKMSYGKEVKLTKQGS